MGNKALGRDLGDLLSRARPARIVRQVANPPGGSLEESSPAASAAGAGAGAPATPPIPGLIPEVELSALQPAEAAVPGGGATGVGAGGIPGGPAGPASGERPGPVPVPAIIGRSPLFHALVVLDAVLVVGAIALAWGGWLEHPLARAAAVLAVAAGGAASAWAVTLPRVVHHGPVGAESRVRVQLTRV